MIGQNRFGRDRQNALPRAASPRHAGASRAHPAAGRRAGRTLMAHAEQTLRRALDVDEAPPRGRGEGRHQAVLGPKGMVSVRGYASRSNSRSRPALSPAVSSASVGSPSTTQAPPSARAASPSLVAQHRRLDHRRQQRLTLAHGGGRLQAESTVRVVATPPTSNRCSAVATACAVISFLVRVPVLSEQMTVTEPSVPPLAGAG